MRVIVILLAGIIVLAWSGFELRHKYRDVSQILYVLAVLLAVLLVGAFFELYGV